MSRAKRGNVENILENYLREFGSNSFQREFGSNSFDSEMQKNNFQLPSMGFFRNLKLNS